MLAKTLANICAAQTYMVPSDSSTSGYIRKPITFFSRRGPELLSKFHGESELNVRVLFEMAQKQAPSIIFFDEIDGFAPVRSAKQNQVHSSVVATMLSCMDGINPLSGVFCIAATNRIDSVDPALRRPGRFDRDLYVPLPSESSRYQFLKNHLSRLNLLSSMTELQVQELVRLTAGFSGADFDAYCMEVLLREIRKNYPELYAGDEKDGNTINLPDLISVQSSISPTWQSWISTLLVFKSSSQRKPQLSIWKREVHPSEKIFFSSALNNALAFLQSDYGNEEGQKPNQIPLCRSFTHILIDGTDPLGNMQANFISLLLSCKQLESAIVHDCSYFSLFQPSHNSESTGRTHTEEKLTSMFREARSNEGTTVFLIHRIDLWWSQSTVAYRSILWECIQELYFNAFSNTANNRYSIIVTSTSPWTSKLAFQHEIPTNIFSFFKNRIVSV
jgi:hypothetical protein